MKLQFHLGLMSRRQKEQLPAVALEFSKSVGGPTLLSPPLPSVFYFLSSVNLCVFNFRTLVCGMLLEMIL